MDLASSVLSRELGEAHTAVRLLFSGCMDDIVTVLAEEHGCLDTIKVESKPLVALVTSDLMYAVDLIFIVTCHILFFKGFFIFP